MPPSRVAAALAILALAATPATSAEPTRRHALLVGCTTYENPNIISLDGPANDVLMMRDLLRAKYHFTDADVVILSEAAGKELGKKYRPTRENIQREFAALARWAEKGDQVFILLSGHGSQQPDSKPDDPERFEPDGLEEIFLPADAEVWNGKDRVRNAIVDYEFRDWLKAIRAKGASVAIVVDACHSASMIRGTVRMVKPEVLIPAEVLRKAEEAARKKAATAPKRTGFKVPPQEPDLVALYAAQSTETTPELDLPQAGKDRKKRGLFTYTICAVLTQAEEPLTYSELLHRVHDRYRAMPRPSPTPLVEGKDRNRTVFGDNDKEPARGADCQRYYRVTDVKGLWKVEAGALHGLTPGSIVAIMPPAGAAGANKPIGYAVVTEKGLGMTEAEVRAIEYGGLKVLKELPKTEGTPIARCELVVRDYGDLRLAVAVDSRTGKDELVPADRLNALAEPLTKLAAEKGTLVKVARTPAEAQWLLQFDSLASGKLYLVPTAGGNEITQPGKLAALPALYGPVPEGEKLQPWIKERLTRIARVQNLIAVTGDKKYQPASRGDEKIQFHVDLVRFRDKEDQEGKPIMRGDSGIALYDGDEIGLRVINDGRVPIDVTLLYVTADYGIKAIYPETITVDNRLAPGDERTIGLTMDANTTGWEYVVVIAVKADTKVVKEYANFCFLAQPNLERMARDATGTGKKILEANLESPLGQLFQNALYGQGKARTGDTTARAYAFRLLSWKMMPGARPADEKKK